jgi:hypothetical protein
MKLYILLLSSLFILSSAVPNAYDVRYYFPKCFYSISDQGPCVSTWAHAIAGMMSNRLCMQMVNVSLSPQFLLSCSNAGKCGGLVNDATIPLALTFAENTGLPTSTCVPYNASDLPCPTKCADDKPLISYKCSPMKYLTNETEVKQEIMDHGPVVCLLPVTKDYLQYYDGIWFSVHSSKIDPVVVKIVGWGIEDGLKYWSVETALGIFKGETGYARIGITHNSPFCTKSASCIPNKA